MYVSLLNRLLDQKNLPQIQDQAGTSSHLHYSNNYSFIFELYQYAYHNAAFLPPPHPPQCPLFSPKPFPFLLFISNAHPPPSPNGGSESGRSTPSLSTYSDGKSPSSTSTYVAAPRHFHIPGRP